MRILRAVTQLKRPSKRKRDAELQVYDNWFFLARIATLTVVILASGLFAVLLPTYFALLQQPCIPGSCILEQISVDGTLALHSLGLSLIDYAILVIILALL